MHGFNLPYGNNSKALFSYYRYKIEDLELYMHLEFFFGPTTGKLISTRIANKTFVII